MKLYMETTGIAAEKTAAEITYLLVQAGATQTYNRYENKKVVGLSFTLDVNGKTIPFCLPVRVRPVFEYLQKRRPSTTRQKKAPDDLEQAERVAWRQLLKWIQAQLAMIDVGMVQSAEVFMPYLEVEPGRTLFEKMVDNGRLLTAGADLSWRYRGGTGPNETSYPGEGS